MRVCVGGVGVCVCVEPTFLQFLLIDVKLQNTSPHYRHTQRAAHVR